MKWSKARFSELFRVKHGYAFKSEFFDTEGPYVLLTPGSFHEEGGFRERGEKTKFYSGDVPDGYILEEGDLLVAMTEQGPGLLGSSAWIPESNLYLHNQRLGRIVDVDEQRLDRRFLYYLFNTRGVRQQISGSASGTKVRHTAPERIGRVEVNLPSLGAQRVIAATLTAYDELMENNRRRMGLLEESARLLYQEWFVRLRFPGHERICCINGGPEGWKKRTLADVCKNLEDGDWIESKDQGGVDYRLLQISNVGMNTFVETENYRFISEETFRRINCREVTPGDLLISRMPTPIGRAWLVTPMPWKMVTAVDVAILTADDEVADRYFLLYHLNSQSSIEHCERRAVGATRPRIARRELAQIPVLLPPKRLQREFREIVQTMNEQRTNLYFQNQKLRAARDLLLPRLMSGEIAV
ncbi:hypothetical protein DB347_25265 [Opitutaceae bacterium EW11]|nr:hypothetical protein DB347_25265 [Opitutaceae bacterium EW11]